MGATQTRSAQSTRRQQAPATHYCGELVSIVLAHLTDEPCGPCTGDLPVCCASWPCMAHIGVIGAAATTPSTASTTRSMACGVFPVWFG